MPIVTTQYLQKVREMVLPLPGVEEYICFLTPAFRVKKKLLARLKEDGETLAVHSDDRDVWMEADVNAFFVTDHYRNYPMVLVRLAVVKKQDLQNVLLEAWTQIAPKRLLAEFKRSH